MRWVDIPYEETDNKLVIQNVEWPLQCPCCGQDHGSEFYNFGTRVVKSITFHSNTSKSETYYPVTFNAPYCKVCKKHASPISKTIYIYIIGFFLWVAVGWLIFINGLAYETLGVVIFLFSAALIGIGCYLISKLIIKIFSKSRMKPTCSNNDYAISACHSHPNIRIRFFRDDYAGVFAATNNLPILMPVEETTES